MVVFPGCKINLGLHVVDKRDDGYHNLETIFYPLHFFDVLEIIQTDKNKNDLFLSGIKIDASTNNNICIKAYDLLKKDFSQLPFLKIYLHKNIPAGAGLGGGSSNGAFMLQLLNQKFDLKIDDEKLIEYALQLGSDCPFFIKNKPCFAQQRGELLEEINLSLKGYHLILINPNIHVNTGWAFTQLHPSPSKHSLKEIVLKPVETWRDILQNDFETPVFSVHPEIKNIKNIFYKNGAVYASMSGSGSTVYGIFDKKISINQKQLPANYLVKEFLL